MGFKSISFPCSKLYVVARRIFRKEIKFVSNKKTVGRFKKPHNKSTRRPINILSSSKKAKEQKLQNYFDDQ